MAGEAPGPPADHQRPPADLRGKVAVVTGAGRGIGRAIAAGLAGAGARVGLFARTAGELADVQQAIEQAGGEALAVAGSVVDPEDLLALVAAVDERWGRLDVLVNNAGISPIFQRAEEIDDDEWRRIIEVNLSGSFYCCRAAFALMARTGGSIVNVSSVAGTTGAERLAAYSASKGGLELLTRTLAIEWASRGIRVNAVAPGFIETDLTRDLLASRWRSRLLEQIPLGRFGQASEVVGAVTFLASEAASYITGATVFIDGGWSAR
jgi:NAD(P)-dependent dehydrogenase (short-subunit alcohol dehydrogenase family)